MTTRFDPFDCRVWCNIGQPGSLEKRARRLCSLPRFERRWKQPLYEDAARMSTWQGRLPIIDDEGNRNERPPEELTDGCPGGWARCGFAVSIMPYMRQRLSSGGHDDNPRVGPSTPAHILDALSYLENHQSHAEAEFNRLR